MRNKKTVRNDGSVAYICIRLLLYYFLFFHIQFHDAYRKVIKVIQGYETYGKRITLYNPYNHVLSLTRNMLEEKNQ